MITDLVIFTIGVVLGYTIVTVLDRFSAQRRIALRLENTRKALELLKQLDDQLRHGGLTFKEGEELKNAVLKQAGISGEDVERASVTVSAEQSPVLV